MYWRNFECELCKHPYPYIFRVMDRIYRLVDINKPETGKYMIMESLPLEKNSSRTIHILEFTEERKSFNMGRGHESQVRVNDISVSRCHAVIEYHPDGIYIKDHKSKFGTLVLVRQGQVELKHS